MNADEWWRWDIWVMMSDDEWWWVMMMMMMMMMNDERWTMNDDDEWLELSWVDILTLDCHSCTKDEAIHERLRVETTTNDVYLFVNGVVIQRRSNDHRSRGRLPGSRELARESSRRQEPHRLEHGLDESPWWWLPQRSLRNIYRCFACWWALHLTLGSRSTRRRTCIVDQTCFNASKVVSIDNLLDLHTHAISISLYLSIVLSIYRSIVLSIVLSFYLSFYHSIDRSIVLSFYLSVYRSIYRSIYQILIATLRVGRGATLSQSSVASTSPTRAVFRGAESRWDPPTPPRLISSHISQNGRGYPFLPRVEYISFVCVAAYKHPTTEEIVYNELSLLQLCSSLSSSLSVVVFLLLSSSFFSTWLH